MYVCYEECLESNSSLSVEIKGISFIRRAVKENRFTGNLKCPFKSLADIKC